MQDTSTRPGRARTRSARRVLGTELAVAISAVALAAWTIAHTPACAWYDFAHMQTAAIAWSRLTPAARARASQLLELNPMYAAWTRNVPARERR